MNVNNTEKEKGMTTTRKRTTAKKAAAPKRTSTTTAKKKIVDSALQHGLQVATVPDARYYKEYISRKIGGHSDFDIFDYAMDTGRNILIEGPTGPGKTSMSLAYAARRKMRFASIPSNVGLEPSQLFGKYIPDGKGGFTWQDGPVTDVIRNGGLLLGNEINFMLDRVATVLFEFLDKRREIRLLDHKGEVVRAHRGGGNKGKCWCDEAPKVCDSKRVLFVADMNPEYEGTRPLNKAFRNRFAIQLFWDYDDSIERRLVKSASLVDMAVALRAEAARGGFDTPVATNMLQEFEAIYLDMDFDFAAINFIQHFANEERAVVQQIINTYRDNIIMDLEDEVVVEADDDNSEEQDDWGVEGVDWAWEDEEEGGE